MAAPFVPIQLAITVPIAGTAVLTAGVPRVVGARVRPVAVGVRTGVVRRLGIVGVFIRRAVARGSRLLVLGRGRDVTLRVRGGGRNQHPPQDREKGQHGQENQMAHGSTLTAAGSGSRGAVEMPKMVHDRPGGRHLNSQKATACRDLCKGRGTPHGWRFRGRASMLQGDVASDTEHKPNHEQRTV